MLVEAPSDCRAEELRSAECEKKLAAHPNPESLAHTRPGHKGDETIDPLDGCPLYRRKDGRIAVFHRPRPNDSPIRTLPRKLHDCPHGRAGLEEMQRELAQAPPEIRAESRKALTFFDKTCAQRGRYAWQRGRFVKTAR